jgi:MarR family transcriptional regulator for hemolysin
MAKLTPPHKQDDTPEAEAMQRRFGMAISDVNRLWRTVINRRLAPLGLTAAQWMLLTRVHQHEPQGMSQAALAKLLVIEQPTLVRLIDQLESTGWLIREPSSEDRRIKLVHLSPTSKKRFLEAQRVTRGVGRNAVSVFATHELELFISLLERLRAQLDAL